MRFAAISLFVLTLIPLLMVARHSRADDAAATPPYKAGSTPA